MRAAEEYRSGNMAAMGAQLAATVDQLNEELLETIAVLNGRDFVNPDQNPGGVPHRRRRPEDRESEESKTGVTGFDIKNRNKIFADVSPF